MPAKPSAGLLLYRYRDGGLEVFLVHPGGPFWAKKDAGVWSLPKGEFEAGEDPKSTALREFGEETGCPAERAVTGAFLPLQSRKQSHGKVVHAWAAEGDCDAANVRSNSFSMEWPPRSGRHCEFPEVDRAGWFTPDQARTKLLPAQVPFLEELLGLLGR